MRRSMPRTCQLGKIIGSGSRFAIPRAKRHAARGLLREYPLQSPLLSVRDKRSKVDLTEMADALAKRGDAELPPSSTQSGKHR